MINFMHLINYYIKRNYYFIQKVYYDCYYNWLQLIMLFLLLLTYKNDNITVNSIFSFINNHNTNTNNAFLITANNKLFKFKFN